MWMISSNSSRRSQGIPLLSSFKGTQESMDALFFKFLSQIEETHVLVVDVDPVSRKSLEETLLLCNYKVTVVDNFPEAFELLRDEKNKFHIAMLDVHQPQGSSFVDSLAFLEVSTIHISSIDDNILMKEALVDGADMVMAKPLGLHTARYLWQHSLPPLFTEREVDKFDRYRVQINILVVDADLIGRRLLKKALINWNYCVTVAEDFQKASSLLTRGNTEFKIAMIDVHQHESEGFHLIELASRKDICTIHISAADDDELVRKGQSLGADLFLRKPVTSKTVRYLWQHVLSKLR